MLVKAPGTVWSPERQVKLPPDLKAKLDFCASNPETVLFLDIETTGLSHHYDEITVVGWSLDGHAHTLIKGEDPKPLLRDAARAKALVTFNGIRFDTRFLRQEFPTIQLPALHIDLMYLLRRVGLKGGQKAIERELAVEMRKELEDVDGFAAVLLWHRYLRGEMEALQRLIRYNRADIAAMGALFDEALTRFSIAPDLFSTQTNFVDWSAPEGWAEAPALDGLPVPVIRSISFDSLFAGTSGASARVVGIDLTGSEKRGSGFCVLEGSHAETSVVFTDDDLINFTIAAKPDLVSIDSPLSLPFGRLRVEDDDPGRNEFGIMRWCERELKRRGVNVYPCLLPSMQRLTARGIMIANRLRAVGIPVIESYPGAAQDIMRIPRKGAGEIWLKLGLSEFGISGDYQVDKVTHDELDAITSALVGTFHMVGMSEALGTEHEAPLIIPKPSADQRPFVIGLSGEIAAGKTTFARELERNGFAYTRFSLALDDLLTERGIKLSRENRQSLGQEINQTGRQRWLGEQTLARVGAAPLIVVDGLRFPEDHAFLVERYGDRFRHIFVSTDEAIRRERFGSRDRLGSYERVATSKVEAGVAALRALAHEVFSNDTTPARIHERVLELTQQAQGDKPCPSQSS